ncbi:MAG: hypothetical protein ACRD8O_18150 [Bryobacteraceae bacterium]
MKYQVAALAFAAAVIGQPLCGGNATVSRPKAGPVEILKSSELKPGMKATAWTVFEGTEPEAVPIEILGVWKNQWGPRQDIIIGKMGGRAIRTNVAGGMSGSPVYIDGKLIGAVALRLSVFSPDAICGITPIELMLEINDFDTSRPSDARTPERGEARQAAITVPFDMLPQAMASGPPPAMVPIDTPLTFSGFHESTLREFGPIMQRMGVSAVQGGAAGAIYTSKPAAGWQNALQPGEPIAGVLVSGDMSVTGLGTVTYNDGKKVLGFGHPFFNLGPVSMPMSRGEVLLTLSSQFQPYKLANATGIVGALTQDRHSGIMGVLGQESEMIPVSVSVRSFADNNTIRTEKKFKFNVFVQQKWTPYLMMVTLFNSISGLNDFREEATYRLSGEVELQGQHNLTLSTMQASGEMPMPAPMLLAGWWGDKFNRLFLNPVTTPKLKRVGVTIDLLPERRIASIENAWVSRNELRPGDDVSVRVFLRPYRGERIERDLTIHVPTNISKGDHRILLSDADTANRMQSVAGYMNRFMDLPQTVSLINQERSNNKLYASLVQSSPTAYYEDKTLPSLPGSVLNVMQAGRASSRPMVTSQESVSQQTVLPFDYVISGSYSLRISVK